MMVATKLTPIKHLDDETIAFLLYGVEDEVYELEPYNKSFQDKAHLILKILYEEYKDRELNSTQFLISLCEKCGKPLEVG